MTYKRKSPGLTTEALGLWVPDDDLLSHAKEHTIIGATPFHGPVRDGKGWDQSAMVVRESVGPCRLGLNPRVMAAFWKK